MGKDARAPMEQHETNTLGKPHGLNGVHSNEGYTESKGTLLPNPDAREESSEDGIHLSVRIRHQCLLVAAIHQALLVGQQDPSTTQVHRQNLFSGREQCQWGQKSKMNKQQRITQIKQQGI